MKRRRNEDIKGRCDEFIPLSGMRSPNLSHSSRHTLDSYQSYRSSSNQHSPISGSEQQLSRYFEKNRKKLEQYNQTILSHQSSRNLGMQWNSPWQNNSFNPSHQASMNYGNFDSVWKNHSFNQSFLGNQSHPNFDSGLKNGPHNFSASSSNQIYPSIGGHEFVRRNEDFQTSKECRRQNSRNFQKSAFKHQNESQSKQFQAKQKKFEASIQGTSVSAKHLSKRERRLLKNSPKAKKLRKEKDKRAKASALVNDKFYEELGIYSQMRPNRKYSHKYINYKLNKCIKMVVMKKNFPAEAFSEKDVPYIRKEITDEIATISESQACPKIEKSLYFFGALLVYCEDTKTAEWLKSKFHDKLIMQPECTLKIVDVAEMPRSAKISFKTVDTVTTDPEVMLTRIDQLNPEFKAKTWRFTSRHEQLVQKKCESTVWVFEIDEEILEAIKAKRNFIYTGLDKTSIRIYKHFIKILNCLCNEKQDKEKVSEIGKGPEERKKSEEGKKYEEREKSEEGKESEKGIESEIGIESEGGMVAKGGKEFEEGKKSEGGIESEIGIEYEERMEAKEGKESNEIKESEVIESNKESEKDCDKGTV